MDLESVFNSAVTGEKQGKSVWQAEVALRLSFLRKVYGILTAQLGLTVLVVVVCLSVPQIREFVHARCVPNWLSQLSLCPILPQSSAEYSAGGGCPGISVCSHCHEAPDTCQLLPPCHLCQSAFFWSYSLVPAPLCRRFWKVCLWE
jgi:hypothetical protein